MPYFPSSIMPKNTKDESESFKFPKTVVSASDFNKHDEEIIAIEKAIGVNRQMVQPISTVLTDCNETDGDGCSGNLACYPVSYGLKDILGQMLDSINSIPDSISMISGIVPVKDDDNYEGADGKIEFPEEWDNAYLSEAVPGDEKSPINIKINNIRGMPESGYITVINDVSSVNLTSSLVDLNAVTTGILYAKVGKKFSAKLTQKDIESISQSVLPKWLSLNGNFIENNRDIIATDIGTTKIGSFSIKVLSEASHLDIYTKTEVPNGTVAKKYSLILDGVLPSDTIAVIGDVSSGLTVCHNEISGTPSSIGSSTITVTKTDAWGDIGTQQLIIKIDALSDTIPGDYETRPVGNGQLPFDVSADVNGNVYFLNTKKIITKEPVYLLNPETGEFEQSFAESNNMALLGTTGGFYPNSYRLYKRRFEAGSYSFGGHATGEFRGNYPKNYSVFFVPIGANLGITVESPPGVTVSNFDLEDSYYSDDTDEKISYIPEQIKKAKRASLELFQTSDLSTSQTYFRFTISQPTFIYVSFDFNSNTISLPPFLLGLGAIKDGVPFDIVTELIPVYEEKIMVFPNEVIKQDKFGNQTVIKIKDETTEYSPSSICVDNDGQYLYFTDPFLNFAGTYDLSTFEIESLGIGFVPALSSPNWIRVEENGTITVIDQGKFNDEISPSPNAYVHKIKSDDTLFTVNLGTIIPNTGGNKWKNAVSKNELLLVAAYDRILVYKEPETGTILELVTTLRPVTVGSTPEGDKVEGEILSIGMGSNEILYASMFLKGTESSSFGKSFIVAFNFNAIQPDYDQANYVKIIAGSENGNLDASPATGAKFWFNSGFFNSKDETDGRATEDIISQPYSSNSGTIGSGTQTFTVDFPRKMKSLTLFSAVEIEVAWSFKVEIYDNTTLIYSKNISGIGIKIGKEIKINTNNLYLSVLTPENYKITLVDLTEISFQGYEGIVDWYPDGKFDSEVLPSYWDLKFSIELTEESLDATSGRIFVSSNNDIYIADAYNNRIRKIIQTPEISNISSFIDASGIPKITKLSTNSITQFGKEIIIEGSSFGYNQTVTFLFVGHEVEYKATNVFYVSPTKIKCKTPVLPSNLDVSKGVVIKLKRPDGKIACFKTNLKLVLDTSNSNVASIKQIGTNVPVFSSVQSDDTPVYDIDISDRLSNGNTGMELGTNVEVMFYSGIDCDTRELLNVYRGINGTTVIRHGIGDIVFKGIASISTTPISVSLSSENNLDGIDCFLRSDGSVVLKGLREKTPSEAEESDGNYLEETKKAYISYQIVLSKQTSLVVPYDPSSVQDDCFEDLVEEAVICTESEEAPVIENTNLAVNAYIGSFFTYQINATNFPESYATTGLSSDFSIDHVTGLISGTLTKLGSNDTVSMTATNIFDTSNPVELVITKKAPLNSPEVPPVITSALVATALIGEEFEYQITADNYPISYTASSLPTGLFFNTTTGIISGTPAINTEGAYDIIITATNDTDVSEPKTLVLNINIYEDKKTYYIGTTFPVYKGNYFEIDTPPQNYAELLDGGVYGDVPLLKLNNGYSVNIDNKTYYTFRIKREQFVIKGISNTFFPDYYGDEEDTPYPYWLTIPENRCKGMFLRVNLAQEEVGNDGSIHPDPLVYDPITGAPSANAALSKKSSQTYLITGNTLEEQDAPEHQWNVFTVIPWKGSDISANNLPIPIYGDRKYGVNGDLSSGAYITLNSMIYTIFTPSAYNSVTGAPIVF